METLFILFFAYIRKVRAEKLQKVAEAASAKTKEMLPVEAIVDTAKQVTSTMVK